MTWYASHIYTEPNPAVLTTLKTNPVLTRGLHLIKNLYEMGDKSGTQNLKVPQRGLGVVRELCAANTEEATWHRYAAINWDDVSGSADVDVILPPFLPTLAFGDLFPTHHREAYPPKPFLQFLKELSLSTQTTVCFYHHMLGAEWAVEQEFAWIFGKEECVYVNHAEKRYEVTKYLPLDTTTMSLESKQNVLNLVLRHFGVNFPTNYFLPHTRQFEWFRLKI